MTGGHGLVGRGRGGGGFGGFGVRVHHLSNRGHGHHGVGHTVGGAAEHALFGVGEDRAAVSPAQHGLLGDGGGAATAWVRAAVVGRAVLLEAV